jgi:hypothetical protein
MEYYLFLLTTTTPVRDFEFTEIPDGYAARISALGTRKILSEGGFNPITL